MSEEASSSTQERQSPTPEDNELGDVSDASSSGMAETPYTDDEIQDCVLNAILDSNRWKETMNMFKDVFNDDLEMDDDLEWVPSVAQAEMLQQFLEENTELVLATGDIEREKSTEISPKWESIAAELNPLGDSDSSENQSPVFWAQYWAKMNNDVHVILAHRANPTPESPSFMLQSLSDVMERIIALVERAVKEKEQNEPDSTIEDDNENMDSESAENATEEEAAVEEPPPRVSSSEEHRRGRKRARRNTARAEARSTVELLKRLGKLQENHFDMTRLSIKRLNIFSRSVTKLTEFVTECSNLVTEEIRRENILN